MSGPEERDTVVRAWAAALRAGETRTWARFREQLRSAEAGTTGPGAGVLAGSAQLELVRRLALLADRPPRFDGLADLVLGTSSPGRGMVDTPLPWPRNEPQDGPAFGTPAIEPELLPDEELLRAACAVLVRLLVERAGVAAPVDRGRWWPRRGFVVLGAPGTAEVVRRALVVAGWRDGGWRPTYLVLGGPLEDLMAQRWAARIRAGGEVRWSRTWRTSASRDRLPPEIRLPEIAARLGAEHGAGRVHVVLGRDPEEVLAGVGTALRIRLEPAPPTGTDVVGTDLLRRLNPLLALAVGVENRAAIVAGTWSSARAAVRSEDRYPAGLAVPPAVRAWAEAAADRMAADLRAGEVAGDYAVHGDPDLVAPGIKPSGDRRPAVDPGDVLELALGMVVELWRRESEGTA